MPDVNLIKTTIQEAQRMNLLYPNQNQSPAFSGYLNTFNYLLELIDKSGSNGQSIEQLAHASGLSINTLRIFTKYLFDAGKVMRHSEPGPGLPYIYRLKR